MANESTGKLHKDLLLASGWGKEIDVVLLLQQGASVKVQDQVGVIHKGRLRTGLKPVFH